jgi:adenylate cyclase
MTVLLRENALQIAFLAVVFLFLLASAAGLVELSLYQGGFRLRLAGAAGIPPLVATAEFLLLAAVGFLLCVALPVLSPIPASLAAVAAVIPLLALGMADPAAYRLLPLEFTILAVFMIYALNVLLVYFRETRAKHKIIGLFSQYVPPHVVEEISRHPDQVPLEGESRRLTVFFCDLQDFSGVAEQLNPKQLTALLNEYFTEMSEILFRYGATIDKYIGDSIMAFWGAPLPQPDHAQRAVTSTFELHDAIKRLSESFVRRGWPGPTMGIGVNTGVMNVGNMGSKRRVTYTVIGDAVNLASRLETLTRTYRVPTIVSEATKNECQGIVFRTLDIVQVRGKHNRTRIYEPLCLEKNLTDDLQSQLQIHEAGIEHYLSGRFDEARNVFEQLRQQYPETRLYDALLQKIART